MTGMIGVAISCEWGCPSEAPAASPWFLNTRTYSRRGSFLRSSMRSRNARSTSATASTGSVASEAEWTGVSITTSWAPTPFIRSKSPSPAGSSSPSLPLLLAPQGTLEERGERVGRCLAVEEYRADLLADGHADAVATRERERRGDRPHPLGDHASPVLNGGDRLAPCERDAELAVARETPGAREDEVAQAREPREGRGHRAERHGEPRHLGEPPRDERSARVLAETEPVDEAGRDRHHVLQRPARLDAHDVAVRVESELARTEPLLELAGERVVARRDHRRRGPAERHLAREGRPGERRHAGVRELLADDLAHAQVAPGAEALGGCDDRHRVGERAHALERRGEELARHDHDDERRSPHRLGDLRCRGDTGRNLEIGQIPGAPPPRPDPLHDLGLARPQTHGTRAARQMDRERRAPTSPADDSDHRLGSSRVLTCGAAFPPSLRSLPARRRVMFSRWRVMMRTATMTAARVKRRGCPSSSAPRGTHAAPTIDPSDT